MGVRNGNRQHGTPIFIDNLNDTGTARVLDRIPLLPGNGSGGAHSEAWLQTLIHRFPQTLPIGEIEPGLAGATSVCMEMPTSAGNVDNLLATARGDLVLTECKLWRNPEARREVVAQILDYAQCMASWSYEDLDAAISRGIRPDGGRSSGSLHEIVGGEQGSDEASFVDAVARNLRRMPDSSGVVVQPRVLARTINLERAVVRIEGGQAAVTAPPLAARSLGGGRRTSISQDHLFEGLAALDPVLPERLKAFLDRAVEIGVFYELNGSLIRTLPVG
jgi:hypothetical protein